MNISLCFITVVGGLTLGHPPLNIVQMLWCNLIMDVLAAIALGTEPYSNDPNAISTRISRKDRLFLPEMWRQIIFMALYQIIVMLVLMYFAGLMFFDEGVNLISSKYRLADGTPLPRLQCDTLIFHTYVLMNLFNSINCRVINPNEKNVFKTLLNNPLFWVILGIEIAIQLGMLFLGGSTKIGSILLGTGPLTTGMQITAWVLGASVLGVNVGIKFIPLHIIGKLRLPDLENEEAQEKSQIAQFNKKLKDKYQKKREEVMSAGA